MQNAKPILFSTPMVKAILNGRKTQTRRVIKDWHWLNGTPQHYIPNDKNHKIYKMALDKSKYKVGDILYVQEDWKVGGWNETSFAIYHSCEPYDNDWHTPNIGQYNDLLADILSELNDIDYPCNEGNYEWEKYKSPLELMDKSTMSKWMARIFLKVTSVRVERLQDISDADIEAEGAPHQVDLLNTFALSSVYTKNNYQWWINLWNSTSKDGYKWEDNPYVFVYEFEKMEKQDVQ